MRRGSVPAGGNAAHTFSRAPQASIPRSSFNRSHGIKTTFNEGLLIPILCDEMLPGDTFSLQMTAVARLSTPLFPIMDNLYLESFFFAVPYRLVWDNWEKFNGFQMNPGDNTDFVTPQVVMPADTGAVELSLADYFGIPTGVPNLSVNSFHFRAYNLIYNEWFRDENMQNSLFVPTGNGPDNYTDFAVRRRGKRYDYFTSCLPFPQKGPDVTLPLGTSAPIIPDPDFNGTPSFIVNGVEDFILRGNNAAPGVFWNQLPTANSNALWDTPALLADLTDASAATINQIREAFQIQKLYERDARGGTRYTEVIRSHFGVTSPDMRLQRPEYLGGGSKYVSITPVAQTSATDPGNNAVGDLGAYGVSFSQGHSFTYSATEHVLILGLVCARADLNYQQGLERMWSRRTRLDYYWPALSHLGEQAVLNKEIYAQGPTVINPETDVPYDDEVFGYQERYAEMRYKPSQITGLFRSQASGSLDSWHLAQDFANLPQLNEEFIVENAPMDRILAVNTEPDFIFDAFISYKCVRPMPVYAVPGLVDHF